MGVVNTMSPCQHRECMSIPGVLANKISPEFKLQKHKKYKLQKQTVQNTVQKEKKKTKMYRNTDVKIAGIKKYKNRKKKNNINTNDSYTEIHIIEAQKYTLQLYKNASLNKVHRPLKKSSAIQKFTHYLNVHQ